MFNSLVTYIFGTSTNNEDTSKPNSETQNKPQANNAQSLTDVQSELDAKNTIQVTSISSSVSGAPGANKPVTAKRAKNGKKQRKQQKQLQIDQEKGETKAETKTKTYARLLESSVEDFDEGEWLFVEKDNNDIESLPRTDSEEETELSVVELKCENSNKTELAESEHENENKAVIAVTAVTQLQRRREQLLKAEILYNGPRHQQQKNYLQRVRNGYGRNAGIKNVAPKAASVERDMAITVGAAIQEEPETILMTQSLFPAENYGANASFDESWFVTPPPCFTSIGPVNMVSSPFENLLIEHPSMSVYHCIRTAQAASARLLNVDLTENIETQEHSLEQQNNQVPRAPNNNAGLRSLTAAEIKQELLTRNSQKCRERKERKNLSRSAIKRTNKMQTNNCKNPRRSDLQQCKVLSGANNNRKICY